MQPGSLVARTKDVTPSFKILMAQNKVPLPEMNIPYVVMCGPEPRTVGWHDDVPCITLEEFPNHWYSAEYFSELQSPDEVSIKEIMEETQVEELCI